MVTIGLTKLMNPQNIDKSKDGDDQEKQITGRGASASVTHTITQTEVNQELKSELRDLLAEHGVSDSEDDEAPAAGPPTFAAGAAPTKSHSHPKSSEFKAPAFSAKRPADEPSGFAFDVQSVALGDDAQSVALGDDEETDSSDGSSDASTESAESEAAPIRSAPQARATAPPVSSESASSILRALEKEWNFDLSAESFEPGRSVVLPPPTTGPTYEDHRRERKSQTEEESERRHIEEVMGNLRDETRTTYGAQNEREQDVKANKLEQVAQLRESLADDGIKTDMIGNPSMNSPMEEIDMVLRTLRLKNDRNRCASLAEEVIVGCAEGLEYVFDGSQKIPILGWQPDYTGYSNTVMVKLHRMRYDTAQVVSEIIERNNLGSMMRVALELGPSLLLYPRQRQHQRQRPGLSEDPSIMGHRIKDSRAAFNQVRARDEINDKMARDERDKLLTI